MGVLDAPAGLRSRGAWAATTNYAKNDIVTYNGGVYRAPAAFTSGATFNPANWEQWAPQTGTSATAKKGVTLKNPFAFAAPQSLVLNLLGIDATDDRFFFLNSGQTDIVMSTDRGLTVSNGKGVPAGITVSSIKTFVRIGAYLYTTAIVVADNTVHLFRATPAPVLNDPLVWTDVLTLTGPASGKSSGCFQWQIAASSWGGSYTDYGFVSDYADPNGGPSLWRSPIAQGGSGQWTKVLGPIAGTRHFHHVWPDPWRPNTVWLTCGDGTGYELWRSTDAGATWTLVLTDKEWQAVQISGTATHVYFAGDSGYHSVFVMKRSDIDAGVFAPIDIGDPHWLVPLPNALPARGPFTDGAMKSSSASFVAPSAALTTDDIGRFVWPFASINPWGMPGVTRMFINAFASTTIAAGSNAAALPQATINVASTASLASAGVALVTTDAGAQVVTYTGKTSTTLTGCTGGTGTMSTGGVVSQATVSQSANGTATGVKVVVGGDTPYQAIFQGAVDPATNVWYGISNDQSSGGTRSALFAYLPGDRRPLLLETFNAYYGAKLEIYQGYVYSARCAHPLLTLDYMPSAP